MKRVVATMVLALVAGCGSGETGSMKASGVRDGKAYSYSEGCQAYLYSGIRTLSSFDQGSRFGFNIQWQDGTVTAPGTFTNELLTGVGIWVTRPGETSTSVTSSGMKGGSVTFDQVAFDDGAEITGHFEGAVLDRTGEHIEASGSFRCVVDSTPPGL